MHKPLEFIAKHLPRVTMEDIVRFADMVDIHDAQAFAAELEAFIQERIGLIELHRPTIPLEETVEQRLARKAAALRADARWTPGETDIQRGRAALLEAFEQPHNLPLPDFVRLANKSRQQIYKDIEARRLLALNVGPRGQRLPDWQLDPVKQRLTQAVLQGVSGIDAWTLYRALSEPLEVLEGHSPVEAVTTDSTERVAETIFNVLGAR